MKWWWGKQENDPIGRAGGAGEGEDAAPSSTARTRARTHLVGRMSEFFWSSIPVDDKQEKGADGNRILIPSVPFESKIRCYTQENVGAKITCMVSNERVIFCGCDDGMIRSYTIEENEQRRTERDAPCPDSISFSAGSVFYAHADIVTCLGCVHGEDRFELVSGSSGGEIKLWNLSLDPAQPVLALSLNGDRDSNQPAISSVCSEVGGRIWCGSSDGLLSRFAISGVKTLRKVQAHMSMINHVLVLRSCPVVATAGSDFIIRVWDAFNMNLLVSYCGHAGPVDCLAECTRSFMLISSSSSDASIRAWSLLLEESDEEGDEAEESTKEQESQAKRESLLDAFDEDMDSDASSMVVQSKGPSSCLCAHLCDPSNPTSTGYITAEVARHGVDLERHKDSASRPPALDYQEDISEHWHIASTEVCTDNSCRYMMFQRTDGKYSIGPHTSHTLTRSDQEDLCRVQGGLSDGLEVDRTTLDRRIPAIPPCIDKARSKSESRDRPFHAYLPTSKLLPFFRRAACGCMHLADGRVYTICRCETYDDRLERGGGEADLRDESFYYMESIRINFRDIAKSNTVNSLPHLDVHDILKGLSLPNHELRNGSYASTCMRKDCSPTSMVLVNRYGDLLVITGGLDGILRLWAHQC